MKKATIIQSVSNAWFWTGRRFDSEWQCAELYKEYHTDSINSALVKASKIMPCKLVEVYFNNEEGGEQL